MRDIEFRAKSIEYKDWVYGYLEWSELGEYYIRKGLDFGFVQVDENTIGQYTGLKDKNGNKIFEGDIVQEVYLDKNVDKTYKERRYGKYIVEYNEDRAGYIPFACGDGCGCCEFEVISVENAEVIGNIYDESDVN